MEIEDIQEIIAKDEHRCLELKKTTGELQDGMHSACAFLNTEGGLLIFGVAPTSLKILGQQVTDNTQREIAQALAGLYPAVEVKPEYIEYLLTLNMLPLPIDQRYGKEDMYKIISKIL